MNYDKLPPHTAASFKRYIEQRTPLGGFGMAVVENNLVKAFTRADSINVAAMKDIVGWLYWEAPAQCWGSPEKVKAWLKGESDD